MFTLHIYCFSYFILCKWGSSIKLYQHLWTELFCDLQIFTFVTPGHKTQSHCQCWPWWWRKLWMQSAAESIDRERGKIRSRSYCGTSQFLILCHASGIPGSRLKEMKIQTSSVQKRLPTNNWKWFLVRSLILSVCFREELGFNYTCCKDFPTFLRSLNT